LEAIVAELVKADFDQFMLEVTGFKPFPWQRRLLGQVLEEGWPALLDLPTGVGKTSTILIALFALAADPERHSRRIALVVDRRIIVDQVDEFSRRIGEALADPERPVSARISTRLRALSSSGEQAVRVVHLRGGVPRDDGWLSAPDQPTIIASTVDQVGSRLLFRGYGVSESMRPVHAGVLSRDTLYLLDEVHLSTAFQETLDQLEGTYAGWAEKETGRRMQVVRMSATAPTAASADAFRLDEDDFKHPVLARRWRASKPAQLDVVKTRTVKKGGDAGVTAKNHTSIARAACKHAVEAAKLGSRSIAVVVNRVDTARRAARALLEEAKGDVVLLTGRMRPQDRVEIQNLLSRTVLSGVKRSAEDGPLFVVATSCIEAGADFDFDALITEAASLDALRQRFGRLNRLGAHSSARAWILVRSDQLGSKAADDPVYGSALKETWNYLTELASKLEGGTSIDFGLDVFPIPEPTDLPKFLPGMPEAPVLFPRYLDMWAETRPAPHPDPDPALWLHGKGAQRDDSVNLIFRADLPASPRDAARAGDDVLESLEFLSPRSDEALSIRKFELERWLTEDRCAWVWTAEGALPILADDLRVGMTIVVAASHGGLFLGTWDPDSTEPVTDLAELTGLRPGAGARLRLDPRTLPLALQEGLPRPGGSEDSEDLSRDRTSCLAWLCSLRSDDTGLPPGWSEVLRIVSNPLAQLTLSRVSSADGRGVWFVSATVHGCALDATTEEAISSFTGMEVGLEQHLEEVEAWASHFASSAHLEKDLAEDVALAGLLHDLGKADDRFQAMLRAGDSIAASLGEPLAKSCQGSSLAARERAQRRSTWPKGFRHELISLALLQNSEPLQSRAHDLDLVAHLVASHHGWCRPWAPSVDDPSPQQVLARLGSLSVEASTEELDGEFLIACTTRFRQLCKKYGWHGLAYLESLVRLADHRASAQPGNRPGAQS
jgi:CRISPR-associated endonuclease/helicase Cas3